MDIDERLERLAQRHVVFMQKLEQFDREMQRIGAALDRQLTIRAKDSERILALLAKVESRS